VRPPDATITAVAAAVALTWFLRAMYRYTGRPGGALDDAYIHFQYATRLAQGHFFEWTPGGGYSTGATSVLWPVLLAPGYWLGFREERMALWAAALGAAGLWLCAWCACRILTDALGSPAAGALGAALVLTSGPILWGCFSGMEVPLVAALAMGLARAVQTGARRAALAVAALLPLARPEWAPVTVAAVLYHARLERRLRPVLALAPFAAYLALNLALTGRMATNGAVARSLWYDADLTAMGAARTWLAQAIDLVRGPLTSSSLVPFGTSVVAAAGVIRPSRAVRWAGLAALLALLATVTVADPYRQQHRYQIPALPLVFVAVVAGVAALASLAASARARRFAAGTLAAVLLASQWAYVPQYYDALAYGCRDIHGQQVEMGRWMAGHLPRGSRIALNDAGAIPLFSGLPALDLVGLGTPAFTAAWREGEGAVFEALERLPPERRPRYLAIYVGWVRLPDLYGRVLHKATLTDNRTCGEYEKVLFAARWDVLDSGVRPVLPHPGSVVDEVDVADLESERAHDYAIDRPARTFYRRGLSVGTSVAEGGRVMHAFERWRARVTPGRDASLVWRTDGAAPARVRVMVDGQLAGALDLPPAAELVEPQVPLPAAVLSRARPEIRVELEGAGEMPSFHYWVLQ
jgi:hypothetical protein